MRNLIEKFPYFICEYANYFFVNANQFALTHQCITI
nr:MAG TPA: hypothetical protein [Caudoviricetes sp.]